MKYLIFNGVVAAALFYLVAGDKINLGDQFEALSTPAVENSKEVSGKAETAFQQTVMETAEQVATVTAERVAQSITERLLQENADQLNAVSTSDNQNISANPIPAIQEEYVETTPNYVIDEKSAVNGETKAPVTSFDKTKPAILLADGEQLMSPRDRQKELDALAQNMEFLFLSTQ